MKKINENISFLVISIVNPEGKWIGNIAINPETMEISDFLKNGYKVEEAKPPQV